MPCLASANEFLFVQLPLFYKNGLFSSLETIAQVERKIGRNSQPCRPVQPQNILVKAFDFSPWRFFSPLEFSAQATSQKTVT